jgi:curved DNA-binding protein CbpA
MSTEVDYYELLEVTREANDTTSRPPIASWP